MLAARGVSGVDAAGDSGIDPIGALVTGGQAPLDLGGAIALADPSTRLRVFAASGVPASDAGASEAQEIGYILAVGVHYLRALIDAGVSNPAAQITLEATADVDVFATVAKLRALRHCWATVLDALGATRSTPPASWRCPLIAG